MKDNNDDRIQRRNSNVFTTSSLRHELSSTRMLQWQGRNHMQITCNTSSASHVQHVVLPTKWYEGTAQPLCLTEFKSHSFSFFFFFLSYWLNHSPINVSISHFNYSSMFCYPFVCQSVLLSVVSLFFFSHDSLSVHSVVCQSCGCQYIECVKVRQCCNSADHTEQSLNGNMPTSLNLQPVVLASW